MFVNNRDRDDNIRFSDIQLRDFHNAYRAGSKRARKRYPIGAPVYRSPEALSTLLFGPATDVWSFRKMIILHHLLRSIENP